MAYGALASLAGVIDRNLQQDKKYISICTKDQMISLREKVSFLQEFLEDISSKSFLPEDKGVFESRIRDTAYKMEDTIELIILTEPGKEKRKKMYFKKNKKRRNRKNEKRFSSYFGDVHVLSEEAMKMKRIIDNLGTRHPLTSAHASSRADIGHPNSTMVVGLDGALSQILDQLSGQDYALRVISITGMGGIGKTTLARASFEAPLTRQHFDLRLWVTVSQEYSIHDIHRTLLPQVEQSNCNDDRLIEHVHKRLKGRRYLIVLDDMWDENVWDRVKIAFPADKQGSRVILTTRLSGLAAYSVSFVYEMQFLDENHSLELLRERLQTTINFGLERTGEKISKQATEFELEGIGKKIAKNCKGLPLALVAVAGILKFNKTIDFWSQVAENTKEEAMRSEYPFFDILCWSYSRLPLHLKACFLYMGTYKEDYEIPMKELARLWAAEGFLKPKANKSMEEVAEDCLKELVERSLVLVTKRRYNGKIRTCSVQDVLREVSIRKAKEENFLYHLSDPACETIGGIRHRRVSVTNYFRRTFCHFVATYLSFPTTHSLIDQSGYDTDSESSKYIKCVGECFKLLRVLNKAHIEEHSHLRILCALTNLRYLHFVCPRKHTFMVPESISKLHDLETLIVQAELSTIVVFPQEIWGLQRLRHIVMVGKSNRLQVPVPNQDCPSLQTLYGVTNINITRRLSERIPNLKKLKLQCINYGPEYTEEYPHQLQELSIQGASLSPPPRLINFVFPQNLKKLTLYETCISWENLSPIGSLPELKVLKLKASSVSGEEWEPIEGGFRQLEHLKMEKLDIKHWKADCEHFPRLQKLVILDCDWLEEVPQSIGEIDTLKTLIVQANKETVRRSMQDIQEYHQEIGNDLLQIIVFWSSDS